MRLDEYVSVEVNTTKQNLCIIIIVILFCFSALNYTVKEESPVNTTIGDDDDFYRDAVMDYWETRFFKNDGRLYTGVVFDRERSCGKTEPCILTWHGVEPNYFITVNYHIRLLDINDNSPIFNVNNISIAEAANVSSRFLIGTVRDEDVGINDVQHCSMPDQGLPFHVIMAEPDSNKTWNVYLEVTQPLDREMVSAYHVPLVATDGGSPTRTTTTAVYVQVADENDNVPTFTQLVYKTSVSIYSLNTTFLTITATDGDSGLNGNVTYSISGSQMVNYFDINSYSGEIFLTSTPPRSVLGVTANLTVTATDGGSPARSSMAMIYVEMVENEHAPTFTQSVYNTSVPIYTLNETFLTVIATDADTGFSGKISYSIDGNQSSISKYFGINTNSGDIYLTSIPPRSMIGSHVHLTVLATDSGIPAYKDASYVEITLLDEQNEHPPHFTQLSYSKVLSIHCPLNQPFLVIHASDVDSGRNARITYSLNTDQPHILSYISINSTTGELVMTDMLPQSLVGSTILLFATAKDSGMFPLSSHVTVYINVTDNNPPFFTVSHTSIAVQKNAALGTIVAVVTAYDLDVVQHIHLSIKTGTGKNYFDIDSHSGLVSVKSSLNGVISGSLTLIVEARDNGIPILTALTTVNIQLVDLSSPSVIG